MVIHSSIEKHSERICTAAAVKYSWLVKAQGPSVFVIAIGKIMSQSIPVGPLMCKNHNETKQKTKEKKTKSFPYLYGTHRHNSIHNIRNSILATLTIRTIRDLQDNQLFASREKHEEFTQSVLKTVCKSLFSFTTLPLTVRLCTCAWEHCVTISRSVSTVSVCLVEATVVERPGNRGFEVSCGEAKSAGALVLVLQPPAEEGHLLADFARFWIFVVVIFSQTDHGIGFWKPPRKCGTFCWLFLGEMIHNKEIMHL